jgi:hypothetical protein
MEPDERRAWVETRRAAQRAKFLAREWQTEFALGVVPF